MNFEDYNFFDMFNAIVNGDNSSKQQMKVSFNVDDLCKTLETHKFDYNTIERVNWEKGRK